jgi:GT2 family glycosyltransferase
VRAAARRADTVIAASECIARDLGVAGVDVIHPGVDLDRFDPSPPSGPPEVLLLGAIEPWKRPDLALEIAARCPDVRLRVAGTPISQAGEQLLAELRRRADQPDLAGRVEFAGRQDAAEALARAHCLLHCADREPYGMVLAEALAAARPAVAPAACGPLEIVDDTCGRLYEPGNSDAGAKALQEALKNSEQLGAAARERAKQFTVEQTKERYAELLNSKLDTRDSIPGERVALVTVTHNSQAFLPTLLESAHRHLPQARVIVVDSGSTDNSAELARAAGATVIELGDNVGFGRASNAGAQAAEEAVTVLINPDVELLDGSLARLDPQDDELLAPLVLSPDGSRQDTAQAEPGSAAALAIALIPPAAMPAPLRKAACPWTADEPRRVGWAVGACIVARTGTLKRLGPFDERIFMYGEDLDLGLRAADQGIVTWFRPDARVLHHGAHSTSEAFGGEPFELLAKQRQDVLRARRGRTRARLDHLLQATTFADRIALKTLTRRDTQRERTQLKALRKAR